MLWWFLLGLNLFLLQSFRLALLGLDLALATELSLGWLADDVSQLLQVERLTILALVHLGVSSQTAVARLGRVSHSDEQTDVEVYRQTEQGFDLLAHLVGDGVHSVENHAQSELMAIGFAKWG